MKTKENKTMHTPTDFKIDDNGDFNSYYITDPKDGNFIIHVQAQFDDEEKSDKEANEMAKFIVTAVNAHEELIETLKDSIRYIDKYELRGTHFDCLRSSAITALTKAGVKA